MTSEPVVQQHPRHPHIWRIAIGHHQRRLALPHAMPWEAARAAVGEACRKFEAELRAKGAIRI